MLPIMRNAWLGLRSLSVTRNVLWAASIVPLTAMMSGFEQPSCPSQDGCGGTRAPSCTTDDGRPGVYECRDRDDKGAKIKQGICVPNRPVEAYGSVFPKYLILAVVYAPPGSNDCEDPGTVSYGDGASVGTTVIAASSFTWNLLVDSLDVNDFFDPTAVVAGPFFDVSGTTAQLDSMTVTKTARSTIVATGPCTDGIDHDEDQIWVLLGPEVQMHAVTASGCATCSSDRVSWWLKRGVGETWAVKVGELKGTLPMRAPIRNAFAAFDIASEDIATMLAANPLALYAGDTTDAPDPARFVPLPATFPYLATGAGSATSRSWEMLTDVGTVSASDATFDYLVGLEIVADDAFQSFVDAFLVVELGWSWTHTNSTVKNRNASTSATVTVGSPSPSYTGPMAFTVYYDTIFKTYAFVPLAGRSGQLELNATVSNAESDAGTDMEPETETDMGTE